MAGFQVLGPQIGRGAFNWDLGEELRHRQRHGSLRGKAAAVFDTFREGNGKAGMTVLVETCRKYLTEEDCRKCPGPTDTDAGGTSFIQLARAPIVIYSRLHSMLALAPRTSTHAQCSASG
jgi:hypothetical protein